MTLANAHRHAESSHDRRDAFGRRILAPISEHLRTFAEGINWLEAPGGDDLLARGKASHHRDIQPHQVPGRVPYVVEHRGQVELRAAAAGTGNVLDLGAA